MVTTPARRSVEGRLLPCLREMATQTTTETIGISVNSPIARPLAIFPWTPRAETQENGAIRCFDCAVQCGSWPKRKIELHSVMTRAPSTEGSPAPVTGNGRSDQDREEMERRSTDRVPLFSMLSRILDWIEISRPSTFFLRAPTVQFSFPPSAVKGS